MRIPMNTWIRKRRPMAGSIAWLAPITLNPVMVYVTDHAGSKVSTAGAKGTVTILSGKAKTIVNLVPDGENALKGSGSYASTSDMKAVVSVTMAGKGAEQARFTPLAKTGAAMQEVHSGHGGR